MFTKIHLKIYDLLFELYGKLYYYHKGKGNEAKMMKCIDKREDILNIMFILKGLI